MSPIAVTHLGFCRFEGRSADGRIVYRSDDHGPTIDGRLAWRGTYCDADGRATGPKVDEGDWQAACAVMHAVHDVRIAREDADREAQWAEEARREAERDAFLDGIERVRGGAYDPHADGVR